MKKLWTEKYRPTKVSEIIGPAKIAAIAEYFQHFKEPNGKKVLLLSGTPGIGKTSLAHALLRENGYLPIEFNASDMRGAKNMRDILYKLLSYRSIVDMFNGGKSPSGIIMDEIDTLCAGGSDKGGMTEFINILKESNQKGGDNDFAIVNPIICTYNNFNDKKKRQELLRYSIEIKINQPSRQEMMTLLNKVCSNEGIHIDESFIKEKIITHAQSDMRRLINILYEIYIECGNNEITVDYLYSFFERFSKKKVDTQLYDATYKLLEDHITISEAMRFYDIDKLLLPMMIHENFIRSIALKTDTDKVKIKNLVDISLSLCENDILQTNMFINQIWELNNYSCYMSVIYPNYLLRQMHRPLTARISLEYTTLFGRMSTYYNNKIFLNELGKKIDTDLTKQELIFLSEIILYHYNKTKQIKNTKTTGKNKCNNISESLGLYKLKDKDLGYMLRLNKFSSELKDYIKEDIETNDDDSS